MIEHLIFVVIIPSFVWVALLVSTWTTLAFQAYGRLGVRHRTMIGLLAVMATQALAGSSTAIATSVYQIGRFPCLMGYYGTWSSLGVIALELTIILYLPRLWPRGDTGNLLRFGRWLSLWLSFNLIALLTFMRSSALCTV